ncbi:MAG TPA: hypothetical protein VED46_12510 [Alphaproteobacteria bacterium]|nr:hypothetical protein [Alphaproteobacteria bacterium]
MSDAPISAPDGAGADSALVEAARAFEAKDMVRAAALWRERAITAIKRDWPVSLAEAVCPGIDLVLLRTGGADAVEPGWRALKAWEAVLLWLSEIEPPLAGGRSTPAHFRKHRRDPAIYRAVARREYLRLAEAGRAVALNNCGEALTAHGREEEALTLFREAAVLRREAFGWREAGLGAILANLAVTERRAGLDADSSKAALAAILRDPVPVGPDRFLALSAGQPDLLRFLLAAAQLVPILRRPAG